MRNTYYEKASVRLVGVSQFVDLSNVGWDEIRWDERRSNEERLREERRGNQMRHKKLVPSPGLTTPRHRAAATAASTAFPPITKIPLAIAEHLESSVAAAAIVDVTENDAHSAVTSPALELDPELRNLPRCLELCSFPFSVVPKIKTVSKRGSTHVIVTRKAPNALGLVNEHLVIYLLIELNLPNPDSCTAMEEVSLCTCKAVELLRRFDPLMCISVSF